MDKEYEDIIIPLGLDDDDDDDFFDDYDKSLQQAMRTEPEKNPRVVVESNGDIVVSQTGQCNTEDNDEEDSLDKEYWDFIAKGGFIYEATVVPMCSGPKPKKKRKLDFSSEVGANNGAAATCDEEFEMPT